jgi:hypothetical protein
VLIHSLTTKGSQARILLKRASPRKDPAPAATASTAPAAAVSSSVKIAA